MTTLYAPVGEEIIGVLADEFLVEGSELADATVLIEEGITGFVAAYPAKEYQSRQRISLHHALRELSPEGGKRLVAQLRRLANQTSRGRILGQYIARFAVPPKLRGTGAADRLMDLFAAEHPQITLHVRSENERAIRFYERHGFSVARDSGDFLIMTRESA
jgi:ribosomal protein S18 acetylase RimI-like enzyme